MKKMRKISCLALYSQVTFGVVIAGWCQAEETLYVAAYGGSNEAVIKEHILEPFAEAHHVKIEYIAGTSASTLARLIAQKGNPEVDVAIMDDGPMEQAVSMGLCEEIKNTPTKEQLYPIALAGGKGKSVGIGIVATGIAYNTKTFEKNGWVAPNSWMDLANERYKNQLLVPSVTNSYGLHTLIGISKALKDSDPSLNKTVDFISEHVAPNVLSFETSSGKISELFQTGQVSIGVWGSGRTSTLSKTGFPVQFVTPKEGAVALQTSICPIVGSNVADLQQLLVEEFLKPATQKVLAEKIGWGPTNRNVALSAQSAEGVVYGEDAVAKLIPVNWEDINKKRDAWTRRWTREIEK